MSTEKVLEITDATFEREAGSDLPLLLDFTGAWCAPCRAIEPHLQAIAAEYGERLRVARVARISKLRSCIATLEEVPRRVVSLRVIGELSGSEVAKSLDLPPGHVAVVLHRAKKQLCRCVIGRLT